MTAIAAATGMPPLEERGVPPDDREIRIRSEVEADGSFSHSVAVMDHAGLLSVQRRVGPTVSEFSCIAPGAEREADGRKAKELYDYFIGLNGSIPPEPIRIAR